MISIITPTYNRAHLLPRMVDSVLNQTYKNWELIIMDDGSTDNSREIIEGYDDSRIKYFSGNNTGASTKRNEGVEKANGSYIIFLDSDDEVKQDWLSYFADKISIDKAQIISCAWEKHDYDGNLVETGFPKNQGALFNNIVINFLAGTLMIKKCYFIESGGYDTQLRSGQHTELLIRFLPIFEKYNVEIVAIKKSLVIIHLHKGERIRNNFDGIFLGSTRTLDKHKLLFEKHLEMHFNYTSIAAVMAMRTGRIKEAKELTLKALKLKPYNPLSMGRFLIAYLPFIRKRFYSNK